MLEEILPPLPEIPGVQVRSVPEFPMYAVTDDGRMLTCVVQGRWKQISPKWRELTCRPNKVSGRCHATLCGNGRQRRVLVHRLILEVFVGPCPEGMEACHANDNPSQNQLSNLRWGTSLSNKADAIRNGKMQSGERNGMSKLTTDDVVNIRNLVLAGHKTTHVARRFGVSHSNVSRIMSRTGWRNS